MNNKKRTVETIDLLELTKFMLKRWWLLLLAGIIGFAGMYAFTKATVKPTYASSFTAYLNNYTNADILNYITTGDLYARSTLAETAAGIAKSDAVKKSTAEEMGILPEQISVGASVDDSSGILTIRIVMTDQALVASVAEAFADVLSVETTRIIQGSSLQIIDKPVAPLGRYSPSYLQSGIKGAMVGVVLLGGLLFLLFMLDDKIKNVDKLTQLYDIPVIGVIPDLAEVNKKSGYYKKSKGYYKDASNDPVQMVFHDEKIK